MGDQPNRTDAFLTGLKVAQAEWERWQTKLQDPTLRRAFELREQAWQLALSSTGDREAALALINEAAELDPEYRLQVTGIQNFFSRRDRSGRVSVPKAINRLVSPLLLTRGFVIRSASSIERTWRQGCDFVRLHAGREERISIRTPKSGRRLGLLVSRERSQGEFHYKDHRDFGCPHEELAYLNQEELDLVTGRLAHLLEADVLPWMDLP